MSEPMKVDVSGTIIFDQSKPNGSRATGTFHVKDSGNPPADVKEGMDKKQELEKQKLEAWAKVIDVQMHFNDMSAKNRQFGLALVGAALGLSIFLLNRQDANAGFLNLYWFSIHVSPLIILGASFGVCVVGYFDVFHYHTLLRGAVAFGSRLERELSDSVFKYGIGLTRTISHYSQLNVDVYKLPGEEGYPTQGQNEGAISFDQRVKEYEAEKAEKRKTARSRLLKFYGGIILLLVLVSLVLSFTIRPPAETRKPSIVTLELSLGGVLQTLEIG